MQMGNLVCAPHPTYNPVSTAEPVVYHDQFYILSRAHAMQLTRSDVSPDFDAVLFRYARSGGTARTVAAYGMNYNDLECVSETMASLPPGMVCSDDAYKTNLQFYNVRSRGMFSGIRYFVTGLLHYLTPLELPPIDLFV